MQGKFPARLRMGLQVIVPGPSGSLNLSTLRINRHQIGDGWQPFSG